MSVNDVKQAIGVPFGKIYGGDFTTIFRALSNAAIAVETFTNRQNYGPAIQQLIYDLGELCDAYAKGEFDLPKLVDVLGKICDGMDADDFESDKDVEIKRGCVYLWDHKVTADERLKYYKDRFSWDPELSVEET